MNLSEQIEKAMIGTDNPDEATFLQTAVPQWLLQSWRDGAKALENKSSEPVATISHNLHAYEEAPGGTYVKVPKAEWWHNGQYKMQLFDENKKLTEEVARLKSGQREAKDKQIEQLRESNQKWKEYCGKKDGALDQLEKDNLKLYELCGRKDREIRRLKEENERYSARAAANAEDTTDKIEALHAEVHSLKKELARRDARLKVKQRAVNHYKGIVEGWDKDREQENCHHEDPDNTGRCIKCQIDMEEVDWDEIARRESQQWAVTFNDMTKENAIDLLTIIRRLDLIKDGAQLFRPASFYAAPLTAKESDPYEREGTADGPWVLRDGGFYKGTVPGVVGDPSRATRYKTLTEAAKSAEGRFRPFRMSDVEND